MLLASMEKEGQGPAQAGKPLRRRHSGPEEPKLILSDNVLLSLLYPIAVMSFYFYFGFKEKNTSGCPVK